jgi:hypothetical protein
MAERVPYYAELLGLTETERAKLDFLIRYHGDANSLPKLEDAAVQLVTGSRYSPNLAVLQRADAMSSWTKPDGSEHAMVRWWYAKPVGEALGG